MSPTIAVITLLSCGVFWVVMLAIQSVSATVQVAAAAVDTSITAGLIFLFWRSREDAQYK
ncbi:hypothetical protein J3R83DRAFT_9580 [Lanmaoa asiatica]|nr:hypothetical protein J3R83DRAFT_9580 [Lanmaoa asiatica]